MGRGASSDSSRTSRAAFAVKMREALEASGKSMAELARQLGVSRQHVSHVMRGGSPMPLA